MNRLVRAAGMGAAAGALAVAPWVGVFRAPEAVVDEVRPVRAAIRIAPSAGPWLKQATGRRAATRGGCGCDEVVVHAENILRDAKIRTGDAEVRNFNVTYISAAYVASIEGEIEIEVEQRADALSGDALAGQIIGALHAGPRCANILIRALNILEDVKVRSGDAIAINRNVVLLDPGVDRGRLDIDVDQEANAKSGEATAGQVIAGAGAGRGADGCGGVRVEAENVVKDVKLRTGEVVSRNENSIRTCVEVGCAPELLALAKRVAAVRMCTEDGCRMVSSAQLRALLAPAEAASPEPVLPPMAEDEPTAEESPPPSEDPSPEPGPSGDPSPSPSPTPGPEAEDPETTSPMPHGSPSPSPTPASV